MDSTYQATTGRCFEGPAFVCVLMRVNAHGQCLYEHHQCNENAIASTARTQIEPHNMPNPGLSPGAPFP